MRESDHIIAKAEIAELVNSWAFFRDQGRWDELLGVFHVDGDISISWMDGVYATFVAASTIASANPNVSVKHQLGVPVVKLNGDRALSEVNVTIMVRAKVNSMEVDTTAYGRFLDLVERRNGRWKILRRTAIYERDRADPVTATHIPEGFFDDLDQHPVQLRFLASTFKKIGLDLSKTAVCNGTPAMNQVYEHAARWIAGA